MNYLGKISEEMLAPHISSPVSTTVYTYVTVRYTRIQPCPLITIKQYEGLLSMHSVGMSCFVFEMSFHVGTWE